MNKIFHLKFVLLLIFFSTFIINGEQIKIDKGQNMQEVRENILPSEYVKIFDSKMQMSDIQSTVDSIYFKMKDAEFSPEHYVFMFKPGVYNLDIKVGYNTQVIGLGESPDDVKIIGAVRTEDRGKAGALCNFWRCVENLSIQPADEAKGNVWAVSQAAPMRRVHILGNLTLMDKSYSSGGFLSNSKIDGTITSGSQQQWLTRNSYFGSWKGGVWNMVFVGTTQPEPQEIKNNSNGDWPGFPYTFVDKTPAVAEKPYLTFTDNKYQIVVPKLKKNSAGFDFNEKSKIIKSKNIYVASNNDSAADINRNLEKGYSIILLPGVYNFTEPLIVSKPNTVVLGLGVPVLTSASGNTVLEVSALPGIRIAGIMIDAGEIKSTSLAVIGKENNNSSNSGNPIVLSDVFFRVGGDHKGVADNCLTINADNVIGDNLWIWRADHGNDVGWDLNRCDNGITVNGQNVTIYGLAVEHFNQYQTIWNGENGRTYFYQSELPYDIPTQTDWEHDGIKGYASYKVSDNVTTHEAYGVGVYSYFRDADNTVEQSAIEAPEAEGILFTHLFTIWLNGKTTTAIEHVINNFGDKADSAHRRSALDIWPGLKTM